MLDPAEITSKQFTVVRLRNGYDAEEVDNFLDRVEGDYRYLSDENRRLKYDLDQERTRRGDLHASADSAALLLSAAQTAADQCEADAHHRAGTIVADAVAEAAKVVADGTEKKHAEIGRLEEQRVTLESKVADLTDSHSKVIKILGDTLERAKA